MLKSCKYCGRIHDATYDCGRKPKRIYKEKDNEAAAFRRKNIWTKLSKQIRERDNYLCQVCIRNRYLTQHTLSWDEISVHHIIPVTEDASKRLDPYNLITLCSQHHEFAESGHIPRAELLDIAREQEDKRANE